MKRYICNNCGYGFSQDELVSVSESDSFGAYHGCPRCKDYDIEEAEECRKCGTLTTVNELEEGLCESCRAQTVKEFTRLLSFFSQPQRVFLNSYYDGKEF